MDAFGTYIVGEIMRAIGEGNLIKAFSFLAIFLVLWIELRGLKKQFAMLNATISKSFAAGEKRFETIEKDVHQIRLDFDTFRLKEDIYGKPI